MSERITHTIMTPHPRFPRTRCGRTLDLVRDRKNRPVSGDAEPLCTRCREVYKKSE
jgi:hypothetical protein